MDATCKYCKNKYQWIKGKYTCDCPGKALEAENAKLTKANISLANMTSDEVDENAKLRERVESAIKSYQNSYMIEMLRELCAAYGDNDWSDDLHVLDIIDKHLHRHLADTESEEQIEAPGGEG